MTSDPPSAIRQPRRARTLGCAALASLVYLALALAVLAPALREPSRLLPFLALLEGEPGAPPLPRKPSLLDHRDQKMVVSVVTRNAATLTSRPTELFGDGQCYPMPRGYTLGEHMIGLGTLAALPWALTHDPILSFNVALVLTLWIAGTAMYALARHFTGSAPAAFVAGLLFELTPRRIIAVSHPYIHGDYWTPLALLFLHRTFARGGVANAVACAAFATLVLCESLYPIVALGLLLAVYVPYLSVLHRDRLRQAALPLALCAAWLLLAGWLIFGPYLETRATWGVLRGRVSTLARLENYLPGHIGFPGFLTTALVLVALVDRVRGARPVLGEDPRLAYLAGALLIVGVTIGRWSLPFLGIQVPSPLALAQRVVPGLDSVRALRAIGIGAGLPIAFLAGYGALVVLERVRPRTMVALLTATVAFVLASRYLPALARPTFGVSSLRLAAYEVRPPEEDIELVRATSGPLLDVPFAWQGPRKLAMSDDLLRVSYGPRPTAACYNSFVSPVQRQIDTLAAALPAREAADALAALGFRTVLLEKGQLLPRQRARFFEALRLQPRDEQRLTALGLTERLVAYRLESPLPVRRDFALLAAGAASAAPDTPVRLTGRVVFTNGGSETFRHPDPIAPSDLVVRWARPTGEVVHEEQARALLPIALAPGATTTIPLDGVRPPAPGPLVVTVARADEPGQVLARQTVEVEEAPPAAPAAPPGQSR